MLEHYGERAKFGRIQAFCALAQYSITLARTEQDITKRNQLLNEASRELARAQHEDENEQLVHLGFGLLEIAKGHGTMASAALAKAKKKKCNGQTNVAADIALAQVRPRRQTASLVPPSLDRSTRAELRQRKYYTQWLDDRHH